VDAVFDNVGGDTLLRSWDLLTPKGTLVSYAIASGLEDKTSILLTFLRQLARLAWWNVLPNGRSASFYNVWSGHLRNRPAFRTRTRKDLGEVFRLLADGVLAAQVAARVPLMEAARALTLAESRAVIGKVVLIP
jgi:NADPH2:quinone reductase